MIPSCGGSPKGVVHLALAAIVNAVWDLHGKVEGKPWKLLADMMPKQLVSCIDFRYITDVLTPEEAFEMLDRQARTKADREARARQAGYPAYTTSVGWMGYSDDKVRAAGTRLPRVGPISRSRSAPIPQTMRGASDCVKPSAPRAR